MVRGYTQTTFLTQDSLQALAEDRIIPRFHLEGLLPGSQVSVIKIDPELASG